MSIVGPHQHADNLGFLLAVLCDRYCTENIWCLPNMEVTSEKSLHYFSLRCSHGADLFFVCFFAVCCGLCFNLAVKTELHVL